MKKKYRFSETRWTSESVGPKKAEVQEGRDPGTVVDVPTSVTL